MRLLVSLDSMGVIVSRRLCSVSPFVPSHMRLMQYDGRIEGKSADLRNRDWSYSEDDVLSLVTGEVLSEREFGTSAVAWLRDAACSDNPVWPKRMWECPSEAPRYVVAAAAASIVPLLRSQPVLEGARRPWSEEEMRELVTQVQWWEAHLSNPKRTTTPKSTTYSTLHWSTSILQPGKLAQIHKFSLSFRRCLLCDIVRSPVCIQNGSNYAERNIHPCRRARVTQAVVSGLATAAAL